MCEYTRAQLHIPQYKTVPISLLLLFIILTSMLECRNLPGVKIGITGSWPENGTGLQAHYTNGLEYFMSVSS